MPEIRLGGETQVRLAARSLRRGRATGVGAQRRQPGDVSPVVDFGGESNRGGGVLHSKAIGSDERRPTHGATGRSIRHSRKGTRSGSQV